MIDTDILPSAKNEFTVESEENYRRLADALPQIVWTASSDGCFDYYNQR